MTECHTLTLEKDDARISVSGTEFCCDVSAKVEGEYTPSTPEVRAPDNSCLEPPSPSQFVVNNATTSVKVFDLEGEEIGNLVFEGTEWFDEWFDDEDCVYKVEC